ncbi:clathrin light chain [Aulographum hederae CBS 113979]|uniref:Clathrin light chain n=1 Tax=Aulographum hederae CBS 113979 TaxID=1176131 RepID=A0A6G1H7A9_9PEZI|nr:clathrin light chain [Aulographum hederae CBS 113979]
MADRFPSLDEIDAGQTETRGDTNFDLVDSTGDGASSFLDRERAALGDDADLFSGPNDNAATVEDGDDDDLLGGGGGNAYQSMGGEEMSGFESSFPAIDTTNEHMAPGGTITGSTEPYLPGAPISAPVPSYSNEPEPEIVREWRERRDLAIQHRDQVSSEKKAATVSEAQKAIDDFYDNYNNKKDKGIARTRKDAEEFLAGREDTSAGGTSWERIAKLVDLRGGKGAGSVAGKERFKELLISLRKDEKAPGATGY